MPTSPGPAPTDNRIRSPRFEEGMGKRVDHAPGFMDKTGFVVPGTNYAEDLLKIIDCISKGHRLPERMYRNGIDRDPDELLENYGIRHLHLGGADSDVLLFVVEYHDCALLLEINSHREFATKPVGATLRRVHERALRAADGRAQTFLKNLTSSLKAGLLQRRKRD